MAGCLFCGEVARKRSVINMHLDHFVPEIAKARKLKLLTDNVHHVPTIRHGRYPARGMWDAKNQPPQRSWKLEPDPLLKLFFVEFGKRMVVSINKAGNAHESRAWELVSIDFWNEAAHEGVQELVGIDEDLHEDAVSAYVDNIFKDLEKTWNTEMNSDASSIASRDAASPSPDPPPPPPPPPPPNKARRTNTNVDGDVHGDVLTGFLLQTTNAAPRPSFASRVARAPWHTPSKRHRPASPGTPSIPIGLLLSLRVVVLGSTTVLVRLDPGTSLRDAIAEVVAAATHRMPELALYAADRLVLCGDGDGPVGAQEWEGAWTARGWEAWVRVAEEARAPPCWGARLVVGGV